MRGKTRDLLFGVGELLLSVYWSSRLDGRETDPADEVGGGMFSELGGGARGGVLLGFVGFKGRGRGGSDKHSRTGEKGNLRTESTDAARPDG